MGLYEYMKNLRQHIFEKLKVTNNSMDDADTIFDTMGHRSRRMSKSMFKQALKEYDKVFDLDRIYGDDLPIYPEFDCPIQMLKYTVLNNSMNFLFYSPVGNKLFSRTVEDMDTLLEILGKGDTDKGNDVLWEIYDMIVHA